MSQTDKQFRDALADKMGELALNQDPFVDPSDPRFMEGMRREADALLPLINLRVAEARLEEHDRMESGCCCRRGQLFPERNVLISKCAARASLESDLAAAQKELAHAR